MKASEDPFFATTIICAEEQMRGWLAKIHSAKDVEKQVAWYDQLAWPIEFLADWQIIAFDQQAAVEFKRLQLLRLRIGTFDLKIAAIARVRDALLLSGNQRDFGRVPGLRIASWIA
jgi:tRNA(fMet)-specific endonuclease VapC